MDSIAQKFAAWVIRLRFVVIAVSFALTLFFVWCLKDISVNTRLGDLVPQKHPYVQVQKQLMDIFGGLNQVSIALVVKEGDIFNQALLSKVVGITRKLYLIEGVNPGRIVSLSARKIKNTRVNQDGFEVKRLMRNAPATDAGMEILRQNIIRNPMYLGPLVSKDLKATLILVDFQPEVTSRRIFKELGEIAGAARDDDTEIYLAGRPILEGWLDYYLPKMGWIFLSTGLIMMVLLYLAFRSKRGILLPSLAAVMATIWGLGASVLLGFRLDPATVLTPFFVLSLGVSHTVQFIKLYYELVKDSGCSSKEAAQECLAHLFVPACAGVVTDGIGFLSLYVVPLAMIKNMAVTSGIGVLALFFTTVTLIPAILSLLILPKRLEIDREERANILDMLLSRVALLVQKPTLRWITLTVFFALAAIGVKGSSLLVIGDDEPGSATLYPHAPYNKAERIINEKFMGTNPYFVLVAGQGEEALINSEILKEMDSLQNYLIHNIPSAGYALSLADYIKGLNMVMFAGDPAYFTIPEQDGTVAEYLFLYSMSGFPGDFDPVVSPDYQYANIKVDFKDHRSDTIKQALFYTREWIQKFHKVDSADFLYAGGDIGVLGAVNEIIEKTLLPNLLQVAALVFICVAVAYGSLVGGLLMMFPLLFNILVVFGLMGFTGVTLTIETLPVAALSIGRGIDYSLYVATRIKEELQSPEGGGLEGAILRALVTSGKAVFFTGVTVAVGSFTWGLSDVRLQARLGLNLGYLTCMNIFGALILLPLLLYVFKPAFLFKNISPAGEEEGALLHDAGKDVGHEKKMVDGFEQHVSL